MSHPLLTAATSSPERYTLFFLFVILFYLRRGLILYPRLIFYVTHAGLEPRVTLLPPPPECWDYRYGPPWPVYDLDFYSHGTEEQRKATPFLFVYLIETKCQRLMGLWRLSS